MPTESTSKYRPSPGDCPLIYPGERPDSSYVFRGSTIVHIGARFCPPRPTDLKSVILGGDDGRERHLIVGYDSNANPAQLEDKFRGTESMTHPVLRGMVAGYDAVYERRIASKGYVPATLVRSPNTVMEAWANVLDREQLEIMDGSEGRPRTYALTRLGTDFILENGALLSPAHAYISRWGAYSDGMGGHIRVEGIPACCPRHPSMSQSGILEAFRQRLDEGIMFDNFVSNIKVESKRRGYNGQLAAGTQRPGLTDVGDHIDPVSWDGSGASSGRTCKDTPDHG